MVNGLKPLLHHRCDVFDVQTTTNENGITKESLVLIHSDIPCRFRYQASSFPKSPPTNKGNGKLYVPASIYIPLGAHILIYLEKNEAFYKASFSSYYATHGEVLVEVTERWI